MKRVIILISIIFTLILFLLSSSKHFLLGTSAFDLGIFEQFTWLISNGYINGVSSLRGISPLQDHFSLILIPLSLIYKIVPSTYTLLFLQSLALGVSPITFISSYSFDKNKSKPFNALLLVIFLSPVIFLVNLSDFHPEVIVFPFMILSLIISTKSNNVCYYIFLFIILSAKKSLVLFTLGLSIFNLLKGNRIRSLITFIISIIWWLLSSRFSFEGGDYLLIRLGYLGNSFSQILINLISKPWLVFAEASPESIFLYTLGLLLPFIVFFSRSSIPFLLSASPIYITNIISSWGMQREFNSPYSIAILPFLIVASLDSINNVEIKNLQFKKSLFLISIILTVSCFVGYSRIGYFNSRYFPRFSESIALLSIKSKIPYNSSILTTNDIAPHFSTRNLIHTIGNKNQLELLNYDYIILPISNLKYRNSFQRLQSLKLPLNRDLECRINDDYYNICTPKK